MAMRERQRHQQRGKNERRPVIDTGRIVSREGGVFMRGPVRTGGSVRRGGGAGMVRLIVFLAVIGAGYWALGTYRNEIVERVPQAYPILKAIGLEVEEPAGYGIEIVSRADRVQDENRQWVVYVRGRLKNTTSRRVSVPRLRITVTSSNARELTWTVEPDMSSLAPGQEMGFQTRYSTGFALRDVRARVRFERK
jgi:hypothetical protein